MPVTYDIETDYLYNKAKEDTLKSVISEMLQDPSMTIEKIAKFTRTSVDFIQKIRNELK